jgi:hypothetical protein
MFTEYISKLTEKGAERADFFWQINKTCGKKQTRAGERVLAI